MFEFTISMQITGSYLGRASMSLHRKLKLISSVICFRGVDVPKWDQLNAWMEDATQLKGRPIYEQYANWKDTPMRICHSPLKANGYYRSVSCISNGQAVLPLLEQSFKKARKLFEAGAYLHQYTSHGVEQDDFISAFQDMHEVVSNYSYL